MEMQLASIPLVFAFFLFLLVLFRRGNKSRAQNLPPGPWKLPVIGSMHHLFGKQPNRAFAVLARKYGPVMTLKLGQINHIVISSAEAAKEIMQTHDINFASRPELIGAKALVYGCTDIVFSPYGSYWRQLRKICVLELLSSRRLRLFASLREEEVSNLVQTVSMHSNVLVNLTKLFLRLANSVTARAAFGKGCRQQQRFIIALKKIAVVTSGFCVADLYPSLKFIDIITGLKYELNSIHREMDAVLDEIIQDHKIKGEQEEQEEQEEEDLVDVLLRIKDHADSEISLTMNNIKAVLLDIFVAGTETTSTVLEWAMTELVRHPEVMKKARAEVRQVLQGQAKNTEDIVNKLHYLQLIIKEALRLHPPLPLLLPRIARETCEISGYKIPKGSRVLVNAWAIGRDPKYWDDAESFKPERFDGSSVDYIGANFEYIPFGAGRRICPGMGFSMGNIQLSLAKLLFHFEWELPDGMKPEEVDMSETFGATVRRKHELYLVPIPHAAFPLSQDN